MLSQHGETKEYIDYDSQYIKKGIEEGICIVCRDFDKKDAAYFIGLDAFLEHEILYSPKVQFKNSDAIYDDMAKHKPLIPK